MIPRLIWWTRLRVRGRWQIQLRLATTQIARDWNGTDEASGFVGYVTRFAVDTAFLARYPVQTVGAREQQEFWIPAEDLLEFDDHIVGRIEVVARFGGR